MRDLDMKKYLLLICGVIFLSLNNLAVASLVDWVEDRVNDVEDVINSTGDTAGDAVDVAGNLLIDTATMLGSAYFFLECVVVTEVADILDLYEFVGVDIPHLTEAERDVIIDYFNADNEYYCLNPNELAAKFQALNSAMNEAHEKARNLFPESSFTQAHDGNTIVDAARHSQTTAIFTRILGGDWGKKLMDAHEVDSSNDSYPNDPNTQYQKLMDLHNNQVGYTLYRHLGENGTGDFSDTQFDGFLNNLIISDNEIGRAIAARCYTYVSTENNTRDIIEFSDELSSLPGLVYIKETGKTIEENGVNCGVPNISSKLVFFDSYGVNTESSSLLPSSEPVQLYAEGSTGNISSYVWTFDRNIKVCEEIETAVYCYYSTEAESLIPNGFGSEKNIYLLDKSPLSVSLQVENEFGERSKKTTEVAWVNNWGIMVPIISSILN